MKIGIVLPSVPGYSETFFNSKIKGLQAHGFEVVLFVNNLSTKTDLTCTIISAPNFSKGKIQNGFISLFCFVKVLIFNFRNVQRLYELDKKDGLLFIKRIRSILINSHLLSQKLDWLHYGFGTMAIDRENVAAAIVAKMAVSFRGFDHYVYPIKNKDCYKSLFSKKVKFHVLSQGMENDLIQQGIADASIVKITPAINTALFSSKTTPPKNPNVILTVARLHWIKGLDYILEALKIIKGKGFDFQYFIVGDGVEQERLQFAVHQLGLTEHVFFLGQLSSLQVKEEMEKATYYLQYSLQEGFCNAVLEAQAMGLICIVSDAEGLSENVLQERTGFVVPKRNPEALAIKLIQVMNLQEVEKEMLRTNAIERIQSVFTIESQVKQFINFYEN